MILVDSEPEAQKERQASEGNNPSWMQVHESEEPGVQFIVVSVSRTHLERCCQPNPANLAFPGRSQLVRVWRFTTPRELE